MWQLGSRVSVRGIIRVFELFVAVIEPDSTLFEQTHLLFREHPWRDIILPHQSFIFGGHF